MNLPEMQAFKAKLITQGHEAYPDLVKIVDALGEPKRLQNRQDVTILDLIEITLIHTREIYKAQTTGRDMDFVGWAYKDCLMVTVGEIYAYPLRAEKVVLLYLNSDETIVTQENKDREIFIPYHRDWYKKVLTLLPQADEIIGKAAKEVTVFERDMLIKELFLDVNDVDGYEIGG